MEGGAGCVRWERSSEGGRVGRRGEASVWARESNKLGGGVWLYDL